MNENQPCADVYAHLSAGMREDAMVIEMTGEAVEAALVEPQRP
ncbi:hypothetical protein ACH4UM_01210 [Streptomyces sp. NPDC020801]